MNGALTLGFTKCKIYRNLLRVKIRHDLVPNKKLKVNAALKFKVVMA